MEILNKFITPSLILVLTLASGLWLSGAGKPLNGLLFNIHKLIALAAVVFTAIQLVNGLKSVGTQPLLTVMIAAAGLSVLALFATGALMSIGKVDYDLLRGIHIAATILLPLSLALAVYLLNGRKLWV